MSIAIEPVSIDSPTDVSPSTAELLQSETIAVRMQIRWPGVRKSLSREHQQQAANTFSAETKSVSISKKLLDTSHPAFRAATGVRSNAIKYWKQSTLPYIEPGIRLLHRKDMQTFELCMTSLKSDLVDAVDKLSLQYEEMIHQARERLGNLFDSADYTANVSDLFAIDWEYPSACPPEYLLQLSPRLYHRECERMKSRFEDAVAMAERSFAEELSQLVGHLAERLSGEPDGRQKVFRDTAVTNLTDFFDRFQRLNIRSNAQLDNLVDQARQVLQGKQAETLRTNEDLRQKVSRDLTRVEASLDGWLTDRPRRRIMRSR
ncbi:hypothetical protein [Rhodopirellula sp. MGV]|uniref:hypothetical protein n=1 Tax=Rhodopirellula sp. MGV TaxID=2023130 RepID=UPI000B9776F4|nr:hypothetical protein [Rhodopirellula sp. MGV]OYP33980.1 hypothetical protein CGZ80_17555 [Rhodopirellula sp. MGV]PNY37259.1 hypothetical protein C2E31_08855 [Rhodopirellula baltica]